MAKYLEAWLPGCSTCGGKFRDVKVSIRIYTVRDETAADNAATTALRAMAHAEGWFVPADYDLDDESETRCPDCARHHRANEPTMLYLVCSERRRALKVGVAGAMSARLKSHRRRGWRLVEMNGRQCLYLLPRTDALAVERTVVERWRSAGVQIASACNITAENGYTETASLDTASVEATVGWLDELTLGKAGGPGWPRGDRI
ncbi:MAG: hypothetical protein JWN03_4332 [Nocardia sp.]|uniref:hypothetical protein n=1 Tax=Nocardia sp. TaxID=1821 RepID=UPI00262C99B0|nr:hypothetical protein [Nocardia sp.]MCU1644057.1 hypothetical protein [Nocardia sp.]